MIKSVGSIKKVTMSKEFHIFKQNTDAIATNRGFYYQYLKTVNLWLANYIANYIANEDNEIYCEREDDIFEYNPLSQTYKFRQIKCYSTASGLNSLEVKSSLLNFYMLYLKYDYQGLFYFESNTTIQPRAGKKLTEWIEQQEKGDFSVTNYLDETREIFKIYIQEKLDVYIKDKNKEEKEEAQEKANDFFQGLYKPTFEKFLESIRWVFSKELDTHKAIANLSEDILKIISEKLKYDNRINKELLLGYLVNMVLEKSIETDEDKRLLTNVLLEETLTKTKIDDSLFRSEIKDLLKANFFIPHILTEPFKRKELFIGRESEFKDMKEFLNNENSLLFIHGIGGMGNTTLVKEFLYREQNSYAHYAYLYAGEDIKQSWVDSGFRKSLSLVMESTNEAFTESLVALQALEGKTLLVIDNIKNIENQKDAIDKIIGLAQNQNFDIVMTSREIIDDIHNPFELQSLSKEDAKSLFNSIYEVEDEVLLEEVLEYLDYHTFFIDMTAKTLKSKKTLTLKIIKGKFENGEFSTIKRKRKESFNDYLNELFSFDELDKEEILILKQLSVFPSFELVFSYLQLIFDNKNEEEFEEILNYLSEKGWLSILNDDGYKLHQIIKEYIWAKHKPSFSEIEIIVDGFNKMMNGVEDAQISLMLGETTLFFETLLNALNLIDIKNNKVATFLTNFGFILYHKGEYKRAESLSYESLRIEKTLANIENYGTVRNYNFLGKIYHKIGDYEDSKSFYKKSLELNYQILGEESQFLILKNYNDLAELYTTLGDYKEALFYLAKALKISQEMFGEEDSNTVSIYLHLALIHETIGEYEKALKSYQINLNFLKKSLGNNHSQVGIAYNNLALLYTTLENEKEALLYYNQALSILENILEENHPHLGNIYNNLGRFYTLFGKFNLGYPYLKKSLNIRITLFGEYHHDTLNSYNELAVYHQSIKDYKNAKQFFFKALEITKELFGEEHSDTLLSYGNIAGFYAKIEDFENARKIYEENLIKCEKTLGIYHIYTIGTYHNLAYVYYNLHEIENSLFYIEKAIKSLTKEFPETHSYLLSMENLKYKILQEKGIPFQIENNNLIPVNNIDYRG